MLSLYIHIPFCARKCNYCDFLSFVSTREGIENYLQQLNEEIRRESKTYKDRTVDTIFIGGGTPSVAEADEIYTIMQTIYDCFRVLPDAEISMEMNPGTVNKEKMSAYKKAGINRLSFGLQSALEDELKNLGRIHDYDTFLQNYKLARELGFSNINVDLMSGLPGQTWEKFEKSLLAVCDLQPEHISAYSLIVEEGTPFFERYGNAAGEKELPTEEEDRRIYELTGVVLEKYGYERYEISNYAKKGFSCKHNIGYWTGKNYIGFGLGAASLYQHRRWKNTEALKEYLSGQQEPQEYQVLSKQEQMEEFMFLGLRLTRGISVKEFYERFAIQVSSLYGEWLENMYKNELLRLENDRIFLSNKGLHLANYVMSGFLL